MPGQLARRKLQLEPSSGGGATLNKLLELVGTGASHVSTASEIARAMEKDTIGPLPTGLQQLARCGNSGECGGNTERDFSRLVKGAHGIYIEPYTIQLRLEEPSHAKNIFCIIDPTKGVMLLFFILCFLGGFPC